MIWTAHDDLQEILQLLTDLLNELKETHKQSDQVASVSNESFNRELGRATGPGCRVDRWGKSMGNLAAHSQKGDR